jgi:hypothetical protein
MSVITLAHTERGGTQMRPAPKILRLHVLAKQYLDDDGACRTQGSPLRNSYFGPHLTN